MLARDGHRWDTEKGVSSSCTGAPPVFDGIHGLVSRATKLLRCFVLSGVHLCPSWRYVFPHARAADTDVPAPKPALNAELRRQSASMAYAPVKTVAPPAAHDRRLGDHAPRRFGSCRLEGTRPQPSRRPLQRRAFRRIYFDVTGLPPTPERRKGVHRRRLSPNATKSLVDRFSAAPLRRGVGAELARCRALRRSEAS